MKSVEPLVNWSIRLTRDEAAAWDHLLYELRRELGVQAINKTDLVRTLMELAGLHGGAVRAELVRDLSAQQDRAS